MHSDVRAKKSKHVYIYIYIHINTYTCIAMYVHITSDIHIKHMYMYMHTEDCKIIGNRATVFNDFSVVNWYKNPLKTVGPVPITLQSAVHMYVQ